MVLVAILVFLAASAGIWFWIVRNRGSLYLWFANLAGALASLIVATIVLMFMSPDETKTRPAYFLYTIMATFGVFFGTWIFTVARFKQDEYPVGRHLIAGACSLVTAFLTFVICAVIIDGK
jgi:hypothetical protein